jgi:CarD family transcriptional regulator
MWYTKSVNKKEGQNEKRRFSVGEVAVYPGHGVGRIESIEEKEFSGTKRAFYIMRILDTDMTIMVPVDGAENAGLRCVIGVEEVKKVYEILKDKNFVYDNSPWNRRYKEYMEKIKSGSIFEVASVLRELYNLKLWKELSFGEKKMFEIAKNLLKKELSFALKKGEDVIEAEIESIFRKSLRE